MKNTHYILATLFTFCFLICGGQPILNVTISSNFIFGGGQGSNFATLSLQPIAIIDAEPDPSNTINFGISSNTLEAGLPATGPGGILTNESIWLNFTYRAVNFTNAKIYVNTNQMVPAGMVLQIQVLSTANIGGVFTSNPVLSPITLSTNQQVLVNNFSSGYTGNGLGTGYQLKYTIENHSGQSLPLGFEIIYEIK
ncbi:hypothetical protein [Flavobacterium sandaracinum]|uniref:Uncharacterized protein n=1 Tax=Flavobacterium sandaracinum TaxID=2541733 RepID=A0A4R5CYG1_9FLAO|nr:hypothetical protein [Flavobacterium sandaracinum]TDE05912.1 hypothetical protein E0F91_04835 [Flavobacterium sandaracinum]